MSLEAFHPAVAAWFARRFARPTEPQAGAWPSIRAGRATLIAAPTGSGKTLAAFLAALDDLVRQGMDGRLEDVTRVVYVSPLKALSNDVQRNLQEPLLGIREELRGLGLPDVPIRTLVRTGDTPAYQRQAMARRPPHILVTTPESLYILLTSERGRALLRPARTLIVDEIHALVGNRRGAHLALSIERLQALVDADFLRVGLSATQRPIEEVARFLVGTAGLQAGGSPRCDIVDAGHRRALDLAIEVPKSPLGAVMSGDAWQEVYDRLAALVLEARTTLVFVNTRRMAERVARHLGERLGAGKVASHHGSLAREQRLAAELALKAGDLRALVATSSLELGIDIGTVDLVCQLGTTRSISALLQRVGRSGHTVDGVPRGRIFPLSRDELVEAAALLEAARRGDLDRLVIPRQPLDILAQQIVAEVACAEWAEDDLYALARRAYPYKDLKPADFDAVVRMLASGFTTRRGRRGAYLHHDAVNGRLRGRRGARLAAITSGGAIPDAADYAVVLEPAGTVVGSVNEDFAVESLAGDIFQLGNASWRILRVEPGRVRVEDARGQPPRIPFWFGEAPARTPELSEAVSSLRVEVAERTAAAGGRDGAARWLIEEVGVAPAAAMQIVDYLAAARSALGVMPSQETLVLERFFDESGGMQLVLHAPFGSRVNRAWGLALRKRFCRQFNFELQAAATEDAVVLSLGPTHSFPLHDVFGFLRRESVREVLVQALLDAPMFPIRWRWNASRALAVLRWSRGKKIPPRLQRMNADDLLALVFPDQVACVENTGGRRDIPDHPLVRQTVRDCLEEAMDIAALEGLLGDIEAGRKRLVARDLREPSPLAQEVLHARPYAYLDDAPLEERRTQAVYSRRWLDPATAADLGDLDAAAIARVREESWPQADCADELHDALVLLGFLTEDEGKAGNGPPGWEVHFQDLIAARRAAVLRAAGTGPRLWIAAERLPQLLAAYPAASIEPPIRAPRTLEERTVDRESAITEILRGRLEGAGPATAESLASSSGLSPDDVEAGLLRLEAEGFILRGRFTPGFSGTEWCARRLLARIHRYTIDRLRREIEPVETADFIRFLLAWQRAAPDQRADGAESLAALIDQLEGYEAPAGAWESEILPARLLRYDPAWIDALCLSGRFVWGRFTPPRPSPEGSRGPAPLRSTPIAFLRRSHLSSWIGPAAGPGAAEPAPSANARALLDLLAERGASFFEDLAAATGILKSQVEQALGELVARGLATADGFAGLRTLLTPDSRRRRAAGRSRRPGAVSGMEGAGRWTRLSGEAAAAAETIAPVLLRRYGVLFRRLLEREWLAPPWRALLGVLRRLEARGEIRGGRFVAGFQGEQFALPEAIGLLRSAHRAPRRGDLVPVSAADPLNLIGILTPGGRVPSVATSRILYRDGVPIAIREAGEVRFLAPLDRAAEWEATKILARGSVPPPGLDLGRPAERAGAM